MTPRYIALKTDMIHSRTLHERDKVQEWFFTAARRINTDFGSCLESGFIITHGDEAQALIKTAAAASAYPFIESLVEMMAPVELRFGFGWGTLSTKTQKMAIGMDGESWQNAKEAIDAARKSRRRVCFRGFPFEMQKELESLANLLLFIHGHWTHEQLQAIQPIRTGETQAAVAKRLRVTEAAISKRLSAAGWREYQDGREVLQELLVKAVLTPEA